MRVLIAVTLVAGCYDPTIEDCQFRCATGPNTADRCPAGTTCRGGVCRTMTTGACAVDPKEACASTPPAPPSCDQKFALLDGCGVVCTRTRKHASVEEACGAGWRAAVLDEEVELSAVPTTSGRFWVGAGRGGDSTFEWTTGRGVDARAWDTGFPMTNGEACAYFEGAKRRLRNDRNCNNELAYLCTTP